MHKGSSISNNVLRMFCFALVTDDKSSKDVGNNFMYSIRAIA